MIGGGIYGLTKTLNLPDVAEERPLYDFALAIALLDESFTTILELRVDNNFRKRSLDSSAKLNFLEEVIK